MPLIILRVAPVEPVEPVAFRTQKNMSDHPDCFLLSWNISGNLTLFPRKQMLGKTASRFVRRYCWSGGQNYQEFLCLITNVWQTLIFFLTWSSGRLCDSVQGFAEGRLASDMQSTSYVLQHKILNGNYASCIKLRNFAPFWKSWFLISERFLQWSHNVP